MRYEVQLPARPLRHLIRCYWTLDTIPGEVPPEHYYLMADCCPEIIFQYNGGFRGFATQSARIRFQHTVCNRFEVGQTVGFFGVRLYPHAVNRLLRAPADETADLVMDFRDCYGSQGRLFTEQVYYAGSTAERIRLTDAFFQQVADLNTASVIEAQACAILHAAGEADIALLQRQSGLSVRQYERKFRAVTGYTPKFFSRLARFQAVKDQYCLHQPATMTSLASIAGYYDQPHFNRDFKAFSGISPRRFFLSLADALPGPAKDSWPGSPGASFDGYLPCGWFA